MNVTAQSPRSPSLYFSKFYANFPHINEKMTGAWEYILINKKVLTQVKTFMGSKAFL